MRIIRLEINQGRSMKTLQHTTLAMTLPSSLHIPHLSFSFYSCCFGFCVCFPHQSACVQPPLISFLWPVTSERVSWSSCSPRRLDVLLCASVLRVVRPRRAASDSHAHTTVLSESHHPRSPMSIFHNPGPGDPVSASSKVQHAEDL